MGGVWTHEFKHLVADAAIVKARSCILPFCNRFRWPKQKSYSLKKFDDKDACFLVKEWARKGNFFADLWVESGGTLQLNAADLAANPYEDGFEFVVWASDLPTDSDAFAAVVQLRACWPRRD